MIILEGQRFTEIIAAVLFEMREHSLPVQTERWQGIAANQQTRELQNVVFEVDLQGIEDLDHWRYDIGPNLPWADDHFRERISGDPLNPGQEWKNWPWGLAANKFRKAERFNHTYMERFWPKYARRTDDGRLRKMGNNIRGYPESDMRPIHGISGYYGDLQDYIEFLSHEPYTRQAWFPLFHPEDIGVGDGGRKMCSLGYQIIVRDGKASIWYPLRSCDARRHFQDDCYLAVRFLLWVIDRCRERNPDVWNDIRPGKYAMHMTSLHCFKNDYDILQEKRIWA